MINGLVYAPLLRVYITGGRDGTVRTWNAVTLQAMRCIHNSNKVSAPRPKAPMHAHGADDFSDLHLCCCCARCWGPGG